MEDNLYYTPTISEFYIGFEYEYMNGDRWEESEMRIQDYKSDGPDYERSDSWFEEEILRGIRTVRVKYLDQFDIESLGWELSYIKHSPFTGKNLNVYVLNIENGFNTGINYTLEQLDNKQYLISSESYSSYGGETYKMAFNLNNKSELIKLMQQLNINNNVKEF